jgi:fibronectin-binding autotransporter adhesin
MCAGIASSPSVTAPNPLYAFTVNTTIPSGTGYGEVCYYCGLTITFINGSDAGISYKLAGINGNSTNQLYLAYDTLIGSTPQFKTYDEFCLYGAPLSILEGSTDNAIWLSTNSFQYLLSNVQIQAYIGGTGLLQLEGVNWQLDNIWIGGVYGANGITVTVSSNSILQAGVVGGTRQGIRLGVPPTINFSNTTLDLAESTLSIASGSSATLENSVYRAGNIISAGTTLSQASFFWGNSEISATGGTMTENTLFATARQDSASTGFFQHLISGGAIVTTTDSYFVAATPCSSGCASTMTSISGSSSNWTVTNLTVTAQTASTSVLSSSGGYASFANCTFIGGNAADVLVLSGGTIILGTTLIETVPSSHSAVTVSGAALSLNYGTTLTPTIGAALTVSSGSATLTNITINPGSSANVITVSGGTMTMSYTPITLTAVFNALSLSGGTANITGSTINGVNYAVSPVTISGGTLNTGSLTIDNCNNSAGGCIQITSGSPTVNLGSGTILTPTGAYALLVGGSSPIITITSATISGGNSVAAIGFANASSAVMTIQSSTVTATASVTAAGICIEAPTAITSGNIFSGTINIIGSVISGGNFSGVSTTHSAIFLQGGTLTISGASTIQKVGTGTGAFAGTCVYVTSGTFTANGSSIFQYCGVTGTGTPSGITLTAGTLASVAQTIIFNASNIVIGPNDGYGISMDAASSGATVSATIAYVSGANQANAALIMTGSTGGLAIVYELQYTNTNFTNTGGSPNPVNLCGNMYTWASVDGSGSSGITRNECKIYPVTSV